MNLVLLCHLTTVIDSHKAEQDQSGFPIKLAAAVTADRGRVQGIKEDDNTYTCLATGDRFV